MPILKSIAVHTSVNQCLRYVLNPDKTEDLLYTSALNCLCDPDEAYLDMKMIYENYSGKSYEGGALKGVKNPVKAIHYIQSFSLDENITPETAHTIAKAFVKKTFGDDVQVVIATHCDKAHIKEDQHTVQNKKNGLRRYLGEETIRPGKPHKYARLSVHRKRGFMIRNELISTTTLTGGINRTCSLIYLNSKSEGGHAYEE